MKGFGPFLFGALVGGGAVFASLSFHFVQTKDGIQSIPKLTPTFAETYVDVRPFTPVDWQQRKNLTAAVLRANKGAIIGEGAVDQTVQAVQGWLPEVSTAPQYAPQR
jgi:hypothetical protein